MFCPDCSAIANERLGSPPWRGLAAVFAGAVIAVLLLALGCSQAGTASQPAPGNAEPTEEEEAPITAADVPMPPDYAHAVRRLDEYRDAIRAAISSGHFHDAHRPLDETNIALERLPSLARRSGVARREWETVVVAGDDLGEALNVIHEAIDAGQSPDYAPHAKAIDSALARLKAAGGSAPIEDNAMDQP